MQPPNTEEVCSQVVVDTNVVLDLLVFRDSATELLQQRLNEKSLVWIATEPMRDELQRVLAYEQIEPRLVHYKRTATDVLQEFDGYVIPVTVAPKAGITCKDPDDQKFIDLAVAHKALLLSKDHAVLCMARRLQALGAKTRKAL